MFKKSVLLGIVSGLLAGFASIVYSHVYNTALETDFSKVAKPVGIIAFCLLGSLMAATGFFLLNKWLKTMGEIVFNLIFVILTFASIAGPFATTLPLDVQSPELFPGFAVPMHFFPALAWFTLKPFFFTKKDNIVN